MFFKDIQNHFCEFIKALILTDSISLLVLHFSNCKAMFLVQEVPIVRFFKIRFPTYVGPNFCGT